jgi:hypothetical protein
MWNSKTKLEEVEIEEWEEDFTEEMEEEEAEVLKAEDLRAEAEDFDGRGRGDGRGRIFRGDGRGDPRGRGRRGGGDNNSGFKFIPKRPPGGQFSFLNTNPICSSPTTLIENREVDFLLNMPVIAYDNKITPIPIHNLSPEEIKLDLLSHQTLAYGLKFAPIPRKMLSDRVIFKHFNEFHHNMMNRYSAYVEKWRPKGRGRLKLKLKIKPEKKFDLDPRYAIITNFCMDIRNEIEAKLQIHRDIENTEAASSSNTDIKFARGFSNMSSRQAKCLDQLKDAKKGIIKPTDKNMGPGISTSNTYKKANWQHLSDSRTYDQLTEEEKDQFCKKGVQSLINILCKYKPDDDQSEFLHTFIKEFDIPSFYIIWKIHKNPIVGRPIVSSCKWLTTTASVLVGQFLKEFIKKFDNILLDSSDVIKFVTNTKVPLLCTLFTLDAVSLYTNIPIKGTRSAIKAMQKMFEMFPTVESEEIKLREFAIDLLELVLHTNLMEFDGKFFVQIFGIAMGTNLAPVLANLYLAMLEKEIKEDRKNDPKFKWPLLFKRFIDDILGIMDGSPEDVEYFMSVFNSYISSIKVTPAKVGNEVDFLDLHIFKGWDFYKTGKLSMKTFQKEGNIYDYIPPTSNHPDHVFDNLITSELYRYMKNSTEKRFFLKSAALFFKRLRRKGYSRKRIRNAYSAIDYSERQNLLTKQNKLSMLASLPHTGNW